MITTNLLMGQVEVKGAERVDEVVGAIEAAVEATIAATLNLKCLGNTELSVVEPVPIVSLLYNAG